MYNSFIDASYDDKLRKIQHFKLHPELLPFVGANYDKYKVILIGESHYVNFKNIFKNWYDKSTVDNTASLIEFSNWFNTREIINEFLCGVDSGSRQIFRYPAQIIQNKFNQHCPTTQSAYGLVAFFNYFQRPNAIPGGSFEKLDEQIIDESKYAMEISDEIFRILNPQKIIFLSKYAYDSYCDEKKKNMETIDKRIDFSNHPDNACWNAENGKKRFESLIRNTDCINDKLVKNSTVVELFAERLYKKLLEKGFSNVRLYDYENEDDSLRYFYHKSKEYNVLSLDEKYTVCIHDRLYVWFGTESDDWEYLPNGDRDVNATDSPNFRKPQKCNTFPYDENSLDILVERSVVKIEEIIKREEQ